MNLRALVFVSALLVGCSSSVESVQPAMLPEHTEILPIAPMKITIDHRMVELRPDGTATIDGVLALRFSGGEVRDANDKTIFSVDSHGYLGGPIRDKSSVPTRVLDDSIGTDTYTALTISPGGDIKQLLEGREIGHYHVTGLTRATRRTAMMLITTALAVIRFEAHGLSISERLAEAQSRE